MGLFLQPRSPHGASETNSFDNNVTFKLKNLHFTQCAWKISPRKKTWHGSNTGLGAGSIWIRASHWRTDVSRSWYQSRESCRLTCCHVQSSSCRRHVILEEGRRHGGWVPSTVVCCSFCSLTLLMLFHVMNPSANCVYLFPCTVFPLTETPGLYQNNAVRPPAFIRDPACIWDPASISTVVPASNFNLKCNFLAFLNFRMP